MRDSPNRLEQLRQLLILDSTAERAYDDLTRLLAETFDVPITIVSLLDRDRDWFKSTVGLLIHESPAASSICEAFFHTNDPLILVEDMLSDPRFASNPYVTGPPFIRSYAGARLVVQGETVGTLCAYDTRPRKITNEQRDFLLAMASAATDLLERRTLQSL